MNDPRYPIGKFERREQLTAAERRSMIEDIAAALMRMREAVTGLTPAQLDTHYRDGGWTLRQVVHHVPDSHLNAYIRFKLALTEESPTIKPYEEGEWAKLPDTFEVPVNVSVTLLHALHRRWTVINEHITDEQFLNRAVFQPQHQRQIN